MLLCSVTRENSVRLSLRKLWFNLTDLNKWVQTCQQNTQKAFCIILEILEISVSTAMYSLYWSKYGPRMPYSPEEMMHVRNHATLIILFV